MDLFAPNKYIHVLKYPPSFPTKVMNFLPSNFSLSLGATTVKAELVPWGAERGASFSILRAPEERMEPLIMIVETDGDCGALPVRLGNK